MSAIESLSPAVAALLDRVEARPNCFTPLRRGHLESVAALIGVPPGVVSELREALREPSVRKGVAGRLYRAWRARKPPEAAVTTRRAPTSAQALLEAARASKALEVLFDGPVEAVATLFGVHPFLVESARGLGVDARSPTPT